MLKLSIKFSLKQKFTAIRLQNSPMAYGDHFRSAIVVRITNHCDAICKNRAWQALTLLCAICSQPGGAVNLEAGKIKDDVIYCKFRRDKYTVVQSRAYDLVKTPYHLLVVAGKDLRGTYICRMQVVFAILVVRVLNPTINRPRQWILRFNVLAVMADLRRVTFYRHPPLNKDRRNLGNFARASNAKFAPRMPPPRAKRVKTLQLFFLCREVAITADLIAFLCSLAQVSM